MNLTIENTDQIVALVYGGQARVWEGKTESGIAVQVLVARIAVHKDSDCAQFEAELKEQKAPSTAERAFPARMVL